MVLLTVLEGKSSVFTTIAFWKMWINTILKAWKNVRCFVSNWWLSFNRQKASLITLLIFSYLKFKNKNILLCDSWLPGFQSIKTTNWLCTNYDSEHFPEGVEAQIWSNMVWQLAAIPFLLLTSVLKMFCAIACFIWGKNTGKIWKKCNILELTRVLIQHQGYLGLTQIIALHSQSEENLLNPHIHHWFPTHSILQRIIL